MNWYEVAKDIIIPVLSPAGAALAFIVVFFRKTNQERRDAAWIIYKDLDWLWQHYRLVAQTPGNINQEQKVVLIEAWMRVFTRLSEDSSAIRAFYDRYLRNTEGQPFLLMANARQRVEEADSNPQKLLDIEVLFALHNFLMLCEPDHDQLVNHRSIVEQYLKQNPALEKLLIKDHAGS